MALVRVVAQSPMLLSCLATLEDRGASLSEGSGCTVLDHLAAALVLLNRIQLGPDEEHDQITPLTLLWMLDAWQDIQQSTASYALWGYVSPVCNNRPLLAQLIRDSWSHLVSGMARQQASLLTRLDWRLRVVPGTELAAARGTLCALCCVSRPGVPGTPVLDVLLARVAQARLPAPPAAAEAWPCKPDPAPVPQSTLAP